MFPTNARELLPWAPVVIRLGLAVIFIAHGGQNSSASGVGRDFKQPSKPSKDSWACHPI
jgi:uncharacterized membrane protein YphA (DoxX/SURF4 family)